MNRRFPMKCTKEERLDIGKRIYDGEISRYEAAELYGISDDSARRYMRMYRDSNHLPPKRMKKSLTTPSFKTPLPGMDDLESMSREELIQEIVKARITEARLKKGYEVKGDGAVILYDIKNTK